MIRQNRTKSIFQKKQIIDAYCRIRTIDQTIPDDVLDFMKDAAIEKIEQLAKAELEAEHEVGNV
jgi:hypothetical protein